MRFVSVQDTVLSLKLTVYSYFSSHHIYNVTLVLHSVCLYKIFQRTFFRFGSESVCKGKGFIFNRQTFSKVFFEKVFFQFENQTFFLAPLLLQGKILKRIFSSPYSASACQLNRSPSRKRMQRYRLFSFLQ